MKVLVLGCNGMAGHVVALYLKEQGYEIFGLAREKSKFVTTIICDATNFEELNEIIQKGNYDFIVNCIGILNQFAENNPDLAILINSYLPHYLVKITKKLNTKIIHLSTDCVFSGKTGKYTEDSLPDGETYYDRSKALGEIKDNKNITIRCSIIGPDIKESGIGLLNWFMKQKKQIYGYKRAVWTGMTTLQLAKTIEAITKQNPVGLYNMVPDCSINKYDLLKLFNRYIRKDKIEIVSNDDVVIDKSLVRTKFEGFDFIIPNYEIMVKELSLWIKNHKDIYINY